MIGVEINRVVYKGDGMAKEFPFTFTILEKSEIIVTLVSPDKEKKELKADYFVDMDKKAVIYPGYAPGEEPSEAERPPILPENWFLVIQRKVRIDQQTSLGEKWPFDVTEDALDKITRILQDINTQADRHLALSPEVDGVDPTLPKPEPNKGFYWDETGKKLISADNPNLAAKKAAEQAAQATASANSASQSERNAEQYKEESLAAKKAAAESERSAIAAKDISEENARISTEKREGIEEHEKNAALSAEEANNSATRASGSEKAARVSEINARQSEQIAASLTDQTKEYANNAKNSADRSAINANAAELSAEQSKKSAEISADNASKTNEALQQALNSQINADWNEEDSKSKAYIKNKPDLSHIQSGHYETLSVSGETSVPTPNEGNNSKTIANTEFVQKTVAGVVDSAPETLNTLNELATALGNDPNFATSVSKMIGEKESKSDANIAHTMLQNSIEEANKKLVDLSTIVNSNQLQRNKAYAVGDIAYSPNLPSYMYLECITAGITGDTEPDFSNIKSGGVTINDGTVKFKTVKIVTTEIIKKGFTVPLTSDSNGYFHTIINIAVTGYMFKGIAEWRFSDGFAILSEWWTNDATGELSIWIKTEKPNASMKFYFYVWYVKL